jgi:hypothetical protein
MNHKFTNYSSVAEVTSRLGYKLDCMRMVKLSSQVESSLGKPLYRGKNLCCGYLVNTACYPDDMLLTSTIIKFLGGSHADA